MKLFKNLTTVMLGTTFIVSSCTSNTSTTGNGGVDMMDSESAEYFVTDVFNKCVNISDIDSIAEVANMIPVSIASVYFGFDSSDVTSRTKHQTTMVVDHPIDDAAACVATLISSGILSMDSNYRVTFDGYCDIRGTDQYNIALGYRRSHSVHTVMKSKIKDELIGNSMMSDKVYTSEELDMLLSHILCDNSFGKQFANDMGYGDSVWAYDRKVEIRLVSSDSCTS